MAPKKRGVTWPQNFAKRKVSANPDSVAPPVNPDTSVTKRGSTCGTVNCCMRVGGRAEITYEGPTVLTIDGAEMGGFTFRGVEPPMLCSGTLWTPKQLSKWEKARREAKDSPGLSEFKKR